MTSFTTSPPSALIVSVFVRRTGWDLACYSRLQPARAREIHREVQERWRLQREEASKRAWIADENQRNI
ncbi:hypothetical protein AOLI_G00133730 [Acnodon oligacanthus]